MEGTCRRRDVYMEGHLHGGDVQIKKQPNKKYRNGGSILYTHEEDIHTEGSTHREDIRTEKTYPRRGHTPRGHA